MTIAHALQKRISRRKYIKAPLSGEDAARLEALLQPINAVGGFRMELVAGDGSAFQGLRRSYGLFSGVQNYIGLIADGNDLTSQEKLGYYGEYIVLHATSMELGTCFVCGTYAPDKCPLPLKAGETLAGVITIGNVEENPSTKERFLRSAMHRKTKDAEEFYEADESVPEWFNAGIEAVMHAPSAVNAQPVRFTYKEGSVYASVKEIEKTGRAMDLGIAKLHFEIGASGGIWTFGNGGTFQKGSQATVTWDKITLTHSSLP